MPNIVVPFLENGRAQSTGDVKKTAWMERKGLVDVFKPVLRCLHATGLLHGVDYRKTTKNISDEDSEKEVSGNCSRWSFSLVYSIVVTLLLATNFGNYLRVFKDVTSFNGVVCNQIITSTWFLQVTLFALNNNINCRHWNHVFKKWDDLARHLGLENNKSVPRCVLLVTILYFLWLIGSMLFMSLGSLLLTGQSLIFTTGDIENIVIWFVYLILYFFFTSSWYLLTASFAVMCFAQFTAFRKFNRKFNDAISGDGKFHEELEDYRLLHEGLMGLLRCADDIFSVYILVAIGTIIPLIIFTLYFVLFESVDTYSYVATWWSVGLSLIQITVVFIGGGAVNHVVSVI